MPRIAYLAGALQMGGAELELVNQVKALQRRGWDPVVFTLRTGQPREEQLRRLGAEVVPVRRWGGVPGRALAIATLVQRYRPEILHAQHFFTNVYALTTAQLCRIPTIGSVQSNVDAELRRTGIVGKLCLLGPRWLTVNSRAAHRRALELGRRPHRTFLLENGLDLDSFADMSGRSSGPWPGGSRVVLGVGRLHEIKRFDRFIEILARVQRTVPSAQGVIVGDGPLRGRLEALAVEGHVGSGGPVRFLGERNDVPTLMKHASAYLLTSDLEGYPNVVQEAMAAGLPVVGAAVGGVPDMVADGETGFLRAREDVHGMADAVVRLLTNGALRGQMAEKGLAFARHRFNLHRLGRDLVNIYETVRDRTAGYAAEPWHASGRSRPDREPS